MTICTDSPKASAKSQRTTDSKKSLLQRRQLSLQARKNKRARDIVVVKPATDTQLDEDIQRLQVHYVIRICLLAFVIVLIKLYLLVCYLILTEPCYSTFYNHV